MGLTSRPIESSVRGPGFDAVAPPAASELPAAPIPSRHEDVLGWLFHPLPVDVFRREYYEKKLLVVSRERPDYYRGLLTLADLDFVLGTHALKHPELNAVGFGREIKREEFTLDGAIDPAGAARLFAEGATLIFGQLHTRLPRLAELCLQLHRAFSSRVQTNIYLTPPREQGFAPHWDSHDTIILQVSGHKLWEIYDTKIELPLRTQGFERTNPAHAAGAVTQTFEMHPGDVLYIPRGVMHAAKTTTETSLHCTVGVDAYTWTDLLVETVAQAGANDPRLRGNLPWGFDVAGVSAEELREKLAILAEHLAQPVVDHFAEKLQTDNRELPQNLLQQVEGLDDLGPRSRVRPRPGLRLKLESAEATRSLVAGRRRVTMPDFTEPALLHVLGASSDFAIGELPDCLDAEGKVTLVRRLVREGILECVDPRPSR